MHITESTLRKQLNDVNKIIDDINDFFIDSDRKRYFLSFNFVRNEFCSISIVDSIEFKIVRQYYHIPKFFEWDKDIDNSETQFLLDFVRKSNRGFKSIGVTESRLEAISKNQAIRRLGSVSLISPFIKICSVFGGDLMMHICENPIKPDELSGSFMSFDFTFYIKNTAFDMKILEHELPMFLRRRAKIKYIAGVEFKNDRLIFHSISGIDLGEMSEELYNSTLKDLIQALKGFFKEFQKEADLTKLFKLDNESYTSSLFDKAELFKEVTIKPNLSKTKGMKLYECLESLEEAFYSDNGYVPYVFKIVTTLLSRTVTVIIEDQKQNKIIYSDRFKSTDENLKLLRNIRYLYSKILTDSKEIKYKIHEMVESCAITKFYEQIIISTNSILIGDFPFIKKEYLPSDFPNGWTFDLQKFIYRSSENINTNDIIKLTEDFLKWLGNNTRYFKEEEVI